MLQQAVVGDLVLCLFFVGAASLAAVQPAVRHAAAIGSAIVVAATARATCLVGKFMSSGLSSLGVVLGYAGFV